MDAKIRPENLNPNDPNDPNFQPFANPSPQKECAKISTQFGLVSLMKNIRTKIKTIDFCTVRETCENGFKAISKRVIKLPSTVKAIGTRTINAARAAAKRAVIGGSVGAVVGGGATAIILGVTIANPIVGAIAAIGFGCGVAGAGFFSGAGISAIAPVAIKGIKLIHKKLSNEKKLSKEIQRLTEQNTEQQQMIRRLEHNAAKPSR